MHTMRHFINLVDPRLVEGRDAPLFHATGPLAALSIVRDNQIRARDETIEGREVVGVSLTRSFRFAQTFRRRDSIIVFQLDQRRLAQNYRFIPRDYFGAMKQADPDSFAFYGKFAHDEFEEFLIGSITKLDRYLTAIHMTTRDVHALGRDTTKDFSPLLNHPKLKVIGSSGDIITVW